MKNYMCNVCVLLLFMLAAPVAYSKTMLFGGQDHKTYLGCIDCSEYVSDSICNGFAKYGNEFSTSGIFNEFAEFGNEFSSKSPWNEFSASTEVPVLVDENGKFYGYFTVNTSRRDAVNFAPALLQILKDNEGNLEKVRIEICRRLGKGS